MDGREELLMNIFVERLWRSVKYENIFLKAYQNGGDLRKGLNEYFLFYNQERFHESLYKTPRSIKWQPSTSHNSQKEKKYNNNRKLAV